MPLWWNPSTTALHYASHFWGTPSWSQRTTISPEILQGRILQSFMSLFRRSGGSPFFSLHLNHKWSQLENRTSGTQKQPPTAVAHHTRHSFCNEFFENFWTERWIPSMCFHYTGVIMTIWICSCRSKNFQFQGSLMVGSVGKRIELRHRKLRNIIVSQVSLCVAVEH